MADANQELSTEELEDQILQRTQRARLSILTHLEKLNGAVLESKTTAEAFVSLTGAIDKQVFDKRKWAKDKEDSKNQNALRAVAVETLKAIKTRQAEAGTPTQEEREIPKNLDFELVPGELDINPAPLNYSDFVPDDE